MVREFNPAHYAKACNAAKDDALRRFPQESCGAILDNGEYLPFVNTSPQPETSFDCSDERAPWFISGKIIAMVHSHPYTKKEVFSGYYPQDFGPSKHDMVQQLSDGIPWGIIATNGQITSNVVFWGDGIPKVPLLNRQFRHGPTGTDGRGDCYALIKDYYQEELGITLPEGPRDFNWWRSKENLYLDNIARAGFRCIPQSEAKPGDIFFAQVNSGVPNHGGVLLNGGLILHHLSNRVSCNESLLRMRPFIVRWITHEKRNGTDSC